MQLRKLDEVGVEAEEGQEGKTQLWLPWSNFVVGSDCGVPAIDHRSPEGAQQSEPRQHAI